MRSQLTSFITFRGLIPAVLLAASASGASAAVRYEGVFFAGDYQGGAAFDDSLSKSARAMAKAFDTWPNWERRGPNRNLKVLPGDAGPNTFLNSIRKFNATGNSALNANDVLVVFYFGHGGFGPLNAGEQNPALNSRDEFLVFPKPTGQDDHPIITDDTMKAEFAAFKPGVKKLFINISCYSGGFWNGNDAGGAGDLEQVPGTVLMASSRENQMTFTGNIGPRPWEPIFLRFLEQAAKRNGRANPVTFQQLYNAAAASGAVVNASRFGDTGEPVGNDFWAIPDSGDFDSGLYSTSTFDEFSTVFVPTPGSIACLGLAELVLGRRARRSE